MGAARARTLSPHNRPMLGENPPNTRSQGVSLSVYCMLSVVNCKHRVYRERGGTPSPYLRRARVRMPLISAWNARRARSHLRQSNSRRRGFMRGVSMLPLICVLQT